MPFKRLKQAAILPGHLIVTPVPNFLFSEQKLKMLLQGGACAMFSTRKNTIPVAAKSVEIG
jgi:hypothetical protein